MGGESVQKQRGLQNRLLFEHVLKYRYNIRGDSLAKGPKLLSVKNYVNQLTDDELTTGHYQQDGATCHTSNASMREIESFLFQDRIISKKKLGPSDLPI